MQRLKAASRDVRGTQVVRLWARESRAVVLAGTLSFVLGMAGCSAGLSSGVSTTGASGARAGFSGVIHGGQNPVVGSAIQLYTVGTSGLKSASAPLLPVGAVTSGAGGYFSIPPGTYNCSSATQVYLTATGGDSGSGTNSTINLMAPLGSCATLLQNASTTSIVVNEITTVAGAYALAPFMSNYTHVGASGSNPVGLVNAMANFNNLANSSSGGPGGASLPAGATVPTTEINTLADILAACINSQGSTSSACSSLFGATGATETVGAALAIAQNPGSSAYTALFSLASSSPPFLPALSAAPNDWTIAINYTGSGTLKSPSGIAIDAAGNAWVTNSAGSGLVQFTSNGTLFNTFSGGGMIGAKALAFDLSGNVLVANPATGSVVKFNSQGTVLSTITSTGLASGPFAIAVDSGNNAWVANLNGTTVTQISSGGTATDFTGSSTIKQPTGVAIDKSGHVWIANYGNSNVVELTNAGSVVSGSPFSDGALQGLSSIAIDGSGNVWVPGATTGTAVSGAVSQFSGTGVAASASPFLGGGLLNSSAVATSGTDVWVVNKLAGTGLTHLQAGQSAPLSPATGLGSLNAPAAIAIDASGDIWTANSGDSSVSQFIGLAAPVVTPLAATVGP